MATRVGTRRPARFKQRPTRDRAPASNTAGWAPAPSPQARQNHRIARGRRRRRAQHVGRGGLEFGSQCSGWGLCTSHVPGRSFACSHPHKRQPPAMAAASAAGDDSVVDSAYAVIRSLENAYPKAIQISGRVRTGRIGEGSWRLPAPCGVARLPTCVLRADHHEDHQVLR